MVKGNLYDDVFDNDELVNSDPESAEISDFDRDDESIIDLSDDGVRVELDVEKDELEDIKKDAKFDISVPISDSLVTEQARGIISDSKSGFLFLINSECPDTVMDDIMSELAERYPEPDHDKRSDVNEFLENVNTLLGYSYDSGDETQIEKRWSELCELVTDKITLGKPRESEAFENEQLADWKIYRMCLNIRTAMKLIACRQYIDELEDTTADLAAMQRSFNNALKNQIYELDDSSRDHIFSLLFTKYRDPESLAADCRSFEKYNGICESQKHFIDSAKKEFDEYITNNDPSKEKVSEKNRSDFDENENLSKQSRIYYDAVRTEKELTAENKKLTEEIEELNTAIDSRWNEELGKYKESVNAVNEKINEYGGAFKSVNKAENEVARITFVPRNNIISEAEKEELMNSCRQYLYGLEGTDKEFFERLVMLDELKRKMELTTAIEEKLFGSEVDSETLRHYFENGHEYSRIRKEDKFSFDDLMSDETMRNDREKYYEYFGSLMRISGDPNIKNHYDIEARILYADGEINSLLTSGRNLETYKHYNLIKSLEQFNSGISSIRDSNVKYRYIENEINGNKAKIKNLDIERKRQNSLIEKAAYEKSKENEYSEGVKRRKAAIKEAEDSLIEAERNLKDYRHAPKLMASYNAIKATLDDKLILSPQKEEIRRERFIRDYSMMIRDAFGELYATGDIVKKKGENSSEYNNMISSIGAIVSAKTDESSGLMNYTESLKAVNAASGIYITAKKNQFWRRANSLLNQSRMNFAENVSLISDIAEKEMERCAKVCTENKAAWNAVMYKKNNIYSIILSEVNEKHKRILNADMRGALRNTSEKSAINKKSDALPVSGRKDVENPDSEKQYPIK